MSRVVPQSWVSRMFRVSWVGLMALAASLFIPACNSTKSTPPVVLNIFPASLQGGVPLWGPICIFWDRALDVGSLPGGFTLTDNLNNQIALGTPFWDPVYDEVIVVPTQALLPNTTYTFAILGFVQSAAKVAFGGNSISFSTASTTLTAAPPFSGLSVTAAPTVATPTTSITVSWTPVPATFQDGNPVATQAVTYCVYSATASGGEIFQDPPLAFVTQAAGGPVVSSIDIGSLTTNTPYFFIVEALEGSGSTLSNANCQFNFDEVTATPH